MSNDPYDQGRFGGQPPSGPDFNEWWRGNQDYLKGLQQGGSGDSTGPLLGEDPNSETPWPQPPQTFNADENSGSEGNGGLNVDAFGTGCLLVFLAALALLLLPLAFVTWICLHPFSPAVGALPAGAWFVSGALLR